MTEQKIIHGDNIEVLKTMPDNHFDSIITDPPYGLQFMNKKWDHTVPSVQLWEESLRVLKPGGHVLSFGGTRTYHRMVVNIEDAGFEIRDQLQWLYGSGFPKNMNISDQFYKGYGGSLEYLRDKWKGWGTALKPACEPICMARKPFKSTIAENVRKWGTGGLNINECRIPFNDQDDQESATWGRGTDILGGNYVGGIHGNGKVNIEANENGRWPANIILDIEAAKLLDEQSGILTTGAQSPVQRQNKGGWAGDMPDMTNYECEANKGGASRFFYVAKPSQYERNKGLGHLEKRKVNDGRQTEIDNPYQRGETERSNTHVTIKPITLMRYLIKLITSKNGIVLDMFSGSGSTGIACKLEMMNFIGIDNDAESCRIALARLNAWNPELYIPQTLF